MNTLRDAILLGTRGATDSHTAFRTREKVEEHDGPVDVFGAIEQLGVPLLFRPLDKLLGACVRLSTAGAGIIVTTRRDLHMQRFTAAHELGHFVLEHEGSLDREIRFPGETANRDLREVAADAFAAEFLMPRWLYIHHAKRHGWTTHQLRDPRTVYQLSLRLAVSYEATCLGLLAQKVLDAATVDILREVTPKKIKQQVLGETQLEDPWADVWVLDEHDDSTTIAAGPHDLFVAALLEHGGSGHLWDTQALVGAGFTIIEDICEAEDAAAVGGPARRRFVLKGPPPGVHQLGLFERRPWENGGNPLKSVTVSVSTYGAEVEGLPRHSRPSLGQQVLH
jgi:hypothetical protein